MTGDWYYSNSSHSNYRRVKMKVLLNIKFYGYIQVCYTPFSMIISIVLMINFNDSLYNWNEWHSFCHHCIKFRSELSYYALFCIPKWVLVNDSVCVNSYAPERLYWTGSAFLFKEFTGSILMYFLTEIK